MDVKSDTTQNSDGRHGSRCIISWDSRSTHERFVTHPTKNSFRQVGFSILDFYDDNPGSLYQVRLIECHFEH